jgi:hypothetical protein
MSGGGICSVYVVIIKFLLRLHEGVLHISVMLCLMVVVYTYTYMTIYKVKLAPCLIN